MTVYSIRMQKLKTGLGKKQQNNFAIHYAPVIVKVTLTKTNFLG